MTKFRVIVADPPWSYEDKLRMGGRVGTKRSSDAHYRTLLIDDIVALPVGELAADDSLLFLWVPNSLVGYGMRTMEAWGFEQKQVYTWVKTASGPSGLAFGMGRRFRNCTEMALVGTRGRPTPAVRTERNLCRAPNLCHSQKPEQPQDSLERMYPGGPWLELFARRERPGWCCLGNECPTTPGEDIRDSLREWAGAPPAALEEA